MYFLTFLSYTHARPHAFNPLPACLPLRRRFGPGTLHANASSEPPLQVTGDPNYYDFDAMQGYRSLEDSVSLFESTDALELTRLVPDLTGVDPDDAFRCACAQP